MSRILALDPGLRTGIARSDGTTATLDLHGAFMRDRGEAMALFADAIGEELEGCHLLLIERPMGKLVATILPEILTARAHEVAFLCGVMRRELNVPTIRKLVCGDARADKKAVQAAVKAAGWTTATAHEADAVAVLMAGIEKAKLEMLA